MISCLPPQEQDQGPETKGCRDSNYACQVKPLYILYECHSLGNTQVIDRCETGWKQKSENYLVTLVTLNCILLVNVLSEYRCYGLTTL